MPLLGPLFFVFTSSQFASYFLSIDWRRERQWGLTSINPQWSSAVDRRDPRANGVRFGKTNGFILGAPALGQGSGRCC